MTSTETATLTDFLLARIAEDEAAALPLVDSTPDEDGAQPRWKWSIVDWNSELADAHGSRWAPARVLAECEAKRRIIELHQSWPVMVEAAPEFDRGTTIDGVTLRLTQQIAWLTQQEYRKRFGSEPPTAPILAALALPYADHPDYREEWRP